MARRVKIELNRKGVRALLRSPEMQAILEKKRQSVMESIPTEKGYTSSVQTRATRVVATVRAETPHAVNDNLKNQTLLKGLNRARD